MPTPEQLGSPSRIFGERFSYPWDGKTVLLEIANQFAREFNAEAIAQLRQQGGPARAAQFTPLQVTTAYPTSQQACPRITIVRTGSQPRPTGLGQEWHEQTVQHPGGRSALRIYAGQTITEQIEVGICTLNERLRDDLYLWFQQYVIDASLWMIPQLKAVGFYSLQCTNAADDRVEYQGTQGQPGFEFHVAQFNYAATFDLTVLTDVDQLRTVFNWEKFTNAGGLYAGAAGDVDGYESSQQLTAPDSFYSEPQNEPTENL